MATEPQTIIHRGYVVDIYDNHFSVITELDKEIRILSRHEYPSRGVVTLPDGTMIDIHPLHIVGKRLFSACREYIYDISRKRDSNKKKREKKPVPKPALEIDYLV